LLDADSKCLENGTFAAEDMCQNVVGCPFADLVIGIGYVSDRGLMELYILWKPGN